MPSVSIDRIESRRPSRRMITPAFPLVASYMGHDKDTYSC
jgi:hypothetical protein